MLLRPSICFAVGAWLSAFIVSTPVHAGILTLSVQETGGPLISINDNAPFDLNPLPGEINADPAVLNAGLVNYEFTTLGATSNAGGATSALLTQTGEVARKSLATGVSLTVFATNDGFILPLNPTQMRTGSTNTFTLSANGDSRAFQSFFDPNDVKGNTGGGTTSSTVLFDMSAAGPGPGVGASVSSTNLSAAPQLFALTNRSLITLGPDTAPGAPHLQFAGSTVVVTTTVPEPVAMSLLMIGAAATLLVRSGMRRSGSACLTER